MKNTLNYTGNVGKNTLHTLPAEYVGEKMPWAALRLPSVLSVSAVCRPSVRAAADTAAAMLTCPHGWTPSHNVPPVQFAVP